MVSFPVLDGLSADERRSLMAAMTRRKFARGEVVFHQGDPGNTFHLIERGHVKISALAPSGDTATLAVLGPGTTFGEQSLLVADAERTATATALDPTHTFTLKADDFHDLRSRHASVDRFLVEVLASQVRRLSRDLADARFLPADQRIARHLLRLVETYDGPEIPLSQDEVAQLAGTTRPTVNRFLRSLGEAVALGRGRITLVDLDRVAAEA